MKVTEMSLGAPAPTLPAMSFESPAADLLKWNHGSDINSFKLAISTGNVEGILKLSFDL
jgi:hypothetical protein